MQTALAAFHYFFETVGIAGFAALWAVKALCGVAILRALRPWWARVTRRGGQGT